jgi:2-hydroxychromene-2-carboxylate isomerase
MIISKQIDYYFATISPWTYLGHDRLVAIARKHGATIAVKPVNFGDVFPASGGLPLSKRAPQRQAYRLVELKRWREFLGMPLNLQPKYFPANGDLAAYWVLAAAEKDAALALALYGAIGKALWVEERDIADAATLAGVAKSVGQDAEGLGARAQAPEISARYAALTKEAIERGVFGAPSYVLDGEIFWGQDRLDFLDRKLAK